MTWVADNFLRPKFDFIFKSCRVIFVADTCSIYVHLWLRKNHVIFVLSQFCVDSLSKQLYSWQILVVYIIWPQCLYSFHHFFFCTFLQPSLLSFLYYLLWFYQSFFPHIFAAIHSKELEFASPAKNIVRKKLCAQNLDRGGQAEHWTRGFKKKYTSLVWFSPLPCYHPSSNTSINVRLYEKQAALSKVMSNTKQTFWWRQTKNTKNKYSSYPTTESTLLSD